MNLIEMSKILFFLFAVNRSFQIFNLTATFCKIKSNFINW
uniref:Uncharacterized protein n=1 Tax=Anguilla anguilla TaxID=7936 RepID=A0A0E9RIN6_ANGAN